MAWALKERAINEVIMVNYNPETVSTDYDVLDKLYFEELTFERVLDIVEKEQPLGVVVSVGGQIPNNLAMRLAENGVKVLGTSAEDIDRAEDRSKFSELLDDLGIEQPPWSRLTDIEGAKAFAREIGYPLLIRPSYVLSGAAMRVVFDEEHLEEALQKAAKVSREYPVVVSKFVTNAREVEVDAVSDGGNVFVGAIIEHVENAGVHSGDATMSIPTLTLSEEVKSELRRSTRKIARSLRIRGPFNIQYMVKNGHIYVIECNLRASRSMPFVSKTVGVNLMEVAADAMLGSGVVDGEGEPRRFCVKTPQFSFMRLEGADPVTGVEMVSTGEVACFGESFEEALLRSLVAAEFRMPREGDHVLFSVGGEKEAAVPVARRMIEAGFRLYATEHTAEAFEAHGVPCEVLRKVREGDPNILDYLMEGRIGMVVNILSLNNGPISWEIVEDEYLIRRRAVEFGVPVITNLELAEALAGALVRLNGGLIKEVEHISKRHV
jgi:carbamoyl-phosphate synthase large subunit